MKINRLIISFFFCWPRLRLSMRGANCRKLALELLKDTCDLFDRLISIQSSRTDGRIKLGKWKLMAIRGLVVFSFIDITVGCRVSSVECRIKWLKWKWKLFAVNPHAIVLTLRILNYIQHFVGLSVQSFCGRAGGLQYSECRQDTFGDNFLRLILSLQLLATYYWHSQVHSRVYAIFFHAKRKWHLSCSVFPLSFINIWIWGMVWKTWKLTIDWKQRRIQKQKNETRMAMGMQRVWWKKSNIFLSDAHKRARQSSWEHFGLV